MQSHDQVLKKNPIINENANFSEQNSKTKPIGHKYSP